MRGVLLGCAVLLAAQAAGAAFEVSQYRYLKAVTGPAQAGYYALPVDPEVVAGTEGVLGDLRLRDDLGREVQYRTWGYASGDEVESLPAKLYNLSRVPGSGTRFELDLGRKAKRTTQVWIDTPDRDFLYGVVVEGREGEERWAVLRRDGVIFDSHVDVSMQNLAVKVPETTFRYLRVTVRDTDRRPMTVTGARVERLGAVAPVLPPTELKLVSTTITQSRDGRSTDLLLDMGYEHQIPEEAEVLFTDDNISRAYQVWGAGSRERQWRAASSGCLYRYHTLTFTDEQTRIRSLVVDGRYVLIRIHNGDNPPLHVTGARLYWWPNSLVFLWDPAHPVSLYYTCCGTGWPQYDLGRYLEYEQVQPLGGLRLGPQQANPAYRPTPRPWSEEHRGVLWAVIAVTVLVIGAMILRLMGKVSAGPQEGE